MATTLAPRVPTAASSAPEALAAFLPLALQLAVVVPAFNEQANVVQIVDRLERVLSGIRFEILFVDDDSPDGTAEEARRLAVARPWVRIIRRIERRGLASACLEGMMATVAPVVAVMDGDLQHDES